LKSYKIADIKSYIQQDLQKNMCYTKVTADKGLNAAFPINPYLRVFLHPGVPV